MDPGPLLLFQCKKIQTDVGMWKQWPLTRTAWPLPWHISVLSHHRSRGPVWSDWHFEMETLQRRLWLFAALQGFTRLPSFLRASPPPIGERPLWLRALLSSGCVLCRCGCYKSLLPDNFTHPFGIMQKDEGGSDVPFCWDKALACFI